VFVKHAWEITMLNAILVTVAALALGALISAGTWNTSRALPCHFATVAALNLAQLLAPTWVSTPLGFVVEELVNALVRFWLVVEVLNRVFEPLPGAQQVARRAVLGGLVATLGLVAWGVLATGGVRATFRALALATGGTGLCLLALRCLTLRYYLPAHPLLRSTMSWFGAYLVLRSLLMGTATEWSAVMRAHAVTLSSAAWIAWVLTLVWASRVARQWTLPAGVPR
jgi:hypothetical protein